MLGRTTATPATSAARPCRIVNTHDEGQFTSIRLMHDWAAREGAVGPSRGRADVPVLTIASSKGGPGKTQCCSFYEPDGAGEVDAGDWLRCAGSQRVGAHLALD